MKFLWGALVCCLALSRAGLAEEDRLAPIQPRDDESVILFLLDNSASLPPLDPSTQRRDAIEKIYTFLQGQPYRLILFGGRGEIYVDAPQHYRNSGQWTDFFFAFQETKEVMAEYPEGTSFKIVLITDGKIDPSPREWADQHVPPGKDLKVVAGDRTIALLQDLGLPLYVILIGEEVDYELIQRMVVAANGSLASNAYAQGIADFFDDDGMLLKRFIFRIEEDEGLEQIEPIVTRIATPSAPRVELSIAGSLLVAIAVLIGIGVRSFPGAGDREVVELRKEQPVYLAVDRMRRLTSDVPAWSRKGLSLVESSRQAVAVLTARAESVALSAAGYSLSTLDPTAAALIELPLPALRERLSELAQHGDKDQQIYVLNLEYVAKDMEEARVERAITASPYDRGKLAAADFLRAKVHLLHNDKLRKKITGTCVTCKVFGLKAEEQELRHGSRVRLGRYTFRVDELVKGGRKDYRLGLTYEQVPSPLYLKRFVPEVVQRALRLRRTHERIVS